MAKHDEGGNPKGRLLFTDFELSGKGRPPDSFPEEDNRPSIAKPAKSLHDLLSSLDFDFEDDEADSAVAAANSWLDEEEYDSISDSRAATEFSGTDEQQTQASRRDRFSPTPKPRPVSQTTRIAGTLAAAEPVDLDFGAIFARAAGLAPDAEKNDGEAETEGEIDWESIASGDDLWLESYDKLIGELDSGDDLLSMVPPEPKAVPEMYPRRPRRRRLRVKPPRLQPYAGIKRLEEWYRPPEEESEDAQGKVERVEDWYEPPPGSDLAAENEKHSTTVKRVNPNPRGGASRNSHSADDLFDTLDIAREWDSRTGESGSDGSGGAGSAGRRPRESDTIVEGATSSAPLTAQEGAVAGAGRATTAAADDREPPLAFALDEEDGDGAHTGASASGNLAEVDTAPEDRRKETPVAAEFPTVAAAEAAADVAENVESPDDTRMESAPEGAEAMEESLPVEMPVGKPDPLPGAADSSLDLDALANAAADAAAKTSETDIQPPVVTDDDLNTNTADLPDMPQGTVNVPGEGEGEDYIPGETATVAPAAQEAVAVNPLDVFANMDAFEELRDDGLDDEMKSLLAEDAALEEQARAEAEQASTGASRTKEVGKKGKKPGADGKKITGKIAGLLSLSPLRRLSQTLAWRENWRFYCDLLAALIATASLAVIVSYFLWYRN